MEVTRGVWWLILISTPTLSFEVLFHFEVWDRVWGPSPQGRVGILSRGWSLNSLQVSKPVPLPSSGACCCPPTPRPQGTPNRPRPQPPTPTPTQASIDPHPQVEWRVWFSPCLVGRRLRKGIGLTGFSFGEWPLDNGSEISPG